MKCPLCNKPVLEKAKFCPHCGGKMPVTPRGRKAKDLSVPKIIKYIDKLSYSAGELALAVGVSRGKIYELMDAGQIPYVFIGTRKVVRRAAAEEFLEKHEVSTEDALPLLVEVS